MRLYVTVPVSETNKGWKELISRILVVSLVLILLASFVSLRFASRLTRPLMDLTEAARQIDKGNYDFEVKYTTEDEVGILTHALGVLAAHTQVHISSLRHRMYVDALTSVRNKGAYGDDIQRLQDQIDDPDQREGLAFGIGVFDCDNLKEINDTYGHDKGDEYLKAASRLICQVFRHSPVYRIGGDEFAVLLQKEDFDNRQALMDLFEKTREDICREAANPWDMVMVAMGLAVYEPQTDPYVIDVARRADRQMYEDKRRRKEAACGTAPCKDPAGEA